MVDMVMQHIQKIDPLLVVVAVVVVALPGLSLALAALRPSVGE